VEGFGNKYGIKGRNMKETKGRKKVGKRLRYKRNHSPFISVGIYRTLLKFYSLNPSLSYLTLIFLAARSHASDCNPEFALLHRIMLLNVANRGACTAVNSKYLSMLKCNDSNFNVVICFV
jgi:hypothetical protein